MAWEYYPYLNDRNVSQGFEVALGYTNDVTTGIFVSFMLLAIWFIFALAPYIISVSKTGSGDFKMSSAIASFITVVVATILRLIVVDTDYALVGDITYSLVWAVFGITLLLFLVTDKQ